MNDKEKFLKRVQLEKKKRRIVAKEGGFVPFCNAFGYQLARHHLFLAEKLERAIHEPDYNLIICMPPGHAKSTYSSILFPSYLLGKYPDKNVIIGSHTAKLAFKWGRKSKRLIQDPLYQYFFNTVLTDDAKASDRFELTNGSEFVACGVGGNITGNRADFIIIDDPVKSRKDADSITMRDNTWEWFLDDLSTRAKPGASIIIIMTRWHEDDLVGRILTSPDRDNWDVLSLPAIAEENDPMGRPIGEALWPEYITGESLLKRKGKLDGKDIRSWNSLYQQRPTIEEGFYFKREWIKIINRLPEGLKFYGASDYAVTGGGGDYTVHVVIGHDEKTDDIYIVDIWRSQTESNIWVESFINLIAKYKPLMWAEESGQIIKSLNPFIEKELDRRKEYVYRQQYTSTSDKSTRARSFQAYMAQGKVFILNNEKWTPPLKSELLSFPDGMHDDQVDALGLIGRMLEEMRMRPEKKQSPTQYGYNNNVLILPGLDAKINPDNSGAFRKF